MVGRFAPTLVPQISTAVSCEFPEHRGPTRLPFPQPPLFPTRRAVGRSVEFGAEAAVEHDARRQLTAWPSIPSWERRPTVVAALWRSKHMWPDKSVKFP